MLKRNAVFSLVLALALFFCLAGPANAEDRPISIGTLEEIYNYIQTLYINKPDSDALIRGAIDGLIGELDDPYTEYMPPQELEDFSGTLDGDYVGVGIQLQPGENYPKVVGTIENTPASKADIKPGDLIVKVDGVDIAKEPLGKVVQKIRGPEGTKVRITIRREGKADFDIELNRANINTPTVTGKMLDEEIGYVKISSFGSHTPREFRKELAGLVQQGAGKLVLDLRDNPGGILQAAVQISGSFIDSGRVVVSTVDRSGKEEEYRSEEKPFLKGMPVVVLINKNSASASEILAGALQDYGAATLIGGQTYGKGTVQVIIPLKEGGALKLTIAKYYTPKERVIDGTGLSPDVQVLTPGLAVPVALNFFKHPVKNTVNLELGKTEAQVNGSAVSLRQTAMRRSDEIYLPLRFVFEALGYRVDWQPDNGSVKVTGDGFDLSFYPGDGITTSGGKKLDGAQPVLYEDGVNYIPVSDLTLLGINVKINGGNVTIEK